LRRPVTGLTASYFLTLFTPKLLGSEKEIRKNMDEYSEKAKRKKFLYFGVVFWLILNQPS